MLSRRRSARCRSSISFVGGTGAGSWLADLIEQSGVAIDPGTVITMSLAAARRGWAWSALLFCAVWLAAFVAALVGPGGAGRCGSRCKRGARMRKFEEQFPEALDLLSRAIRAGHAFQTAMGMVADELPAPVGVEFKKSSSSRTSACRCRRRSTTSPCACRSWT